MLLERGLCVRLRAMGVVWIPGIVEPERRVHVAVRLPQVPIVVVTLRHGLALLRLEAGFCDAVEAILQLRARSFWLQRQNGRIHPRLGVPEGVAIVCSRSEASGRHAMIPIWP